MKNLLLSILFFPLMIQAQTVESVLALVGNQVIYKTELESYIKDLRKKSFKDLVFMNKRKYRRIRRNKKQALNYLIDLKLIDLQSQKAALKIPQSQINAKLREVLSENKQNLKTFKRKLNTSFEEFKKSLELDLKRNIMIGKEIDRQIKINDEEVFRRLGTKSFAKKIKISFVSFKTKKQAMKAYSQIKKNKSLFSKMKKSKGGLLGALSEEEMSHELKKVILKTKESEVSNQPLKMNEAYSLLRVDKITKTLKSSYRKSYMKTKNKLREKRRYQLLSEWVQKLRKKHFIKINKT